MSYILGIDASLNSSGFCVLEINKKDGTKTPKIAELGHIPMKTKYETNQKLNIISATFQLLLAKYQPLHNNIYIEKGFSRFAGSSQALFKVRGVIEMGLGCGYYNLVDITPTQVKKEITGKSGKADKDDVMKAVCDIFKMNKEDFATDDESDALAIAYLGWRREFGGK